MMVLLNIFKYVFLGCLVYLVLLGLIRTRILNYNAYRNYFSIKDTNVFVDVNESLRIFVDNQTTLREVNTSTGIGQSSTKFGNSTTAILSETLDLSVKKETQKISKLNSSSDVERSLKSISTKKTTDVVGRHNACTSCFEHNFKYIIQNEQICNAKPGESIDLLILIFTTHGNKEARSAIRSTWLTYSKNNTANVRYAFLLGEIKDEKLKEVVLAENKIFHDIVKEDFVDTYMNLTYKTIMGFKWAITQCAHAHYVMKTDDDMFVNIPNLLKMLNRQNETTIKSSILGACHQLAKPIRDKKSKWYASERSYPDKYYPGFCSGTGYVTSMQAAKAIYNITPNIPFFHLEDVYIALCVKKLGFKLVKISGFNAARQNLDPCIYHGDKLITSHQLPPHMLLSIWKMTCLKPQKVNK